MAVVSKLEKIRDYFCGCPYLKDGMFNIDYLGNEAIQYAIVSQINASPVIKRYTDGEKLMQYPFSFMSVEQYSSDILDQISASGFYEQLEKWINEQNDIGNLPDIPNIQSIEVLAPGYLFDVYGTGMAKYEIQCRVTYLEY